MRYMICTVLAAVLFLGGCAVEGNKDSQLGLLLSALQSPKKAPIDLGSAAQLGGPSAAVRSGTIPFAWYLSPANASTINDGAAIVIAFSEEMDPSTLVLGGTMASQASVAWYTYQVANQYMIISPNPTWTAGAGRTLTIDVDDIQGDSLVTLSLSYTVVSDTTPPAVVSVSPADNSEIWDVTQIKFVFNEQLDSTKTPVFGGTMAGQVNGWTYSTTSIAGDTLLVDAKTLAVPAGRWTAGLGRTLNVKVEDTSGNSTTTSNYTYDVSAIADGIVYVKTTGNDANMGTKNSPLATIGAGLTKVQTLMGTGRVNIAAGTYNESVTMNKDNISIYGGYSTSDWAVRDPATHVTYVSWSPEFGNGIYIHGSNETITTATVVDGVNVTGWFGINLFKASPTISNNTINANTNGISALKISDFSSANITNNVINAPASTAAGSNSVDISINGASTTSSLTISGNTLNGGSCTGDCSARGVFSSIGSGVTSASISITGNTVTAGVGKWGYGMGLFSSSTNGTYTVSDNTINAGTSSDLTQGMNLDGYAGSPTWTITENTIDGGTGKTSYGIDAEQSGTLVVRRNRIFAVSSGAAGSLSIGIHPTMDGNTLTNNIIGGGKGATSRTVSGSSGHTLTMLNNTVIGGTGTSNVLLQTGGAPGRIENNILMDTGGGTYCLTSAIDSTNPVITIKNNVINGSCTYIVRDNGNGCGGGTDCSLAQLNGLGSSYGGNVGNDPLFTDADGADNDASTFADNDYTLSGSTPASVYQGGLDLSGDFTVDYTGATRTVSWSIGAYEKN